MKKRVTVTLEESQSVKLRNYADLVDRSVSSVVRRLIDEHLDDLAWDEAFGRTQAELTRWAAAVDREIEAGEVEDGGFAI